MVVAHVLTSLEIGGAERVALALAEGQVAASHDVMVVSLGLESNSPLAASFQERGVDVHHVEKRPGLDPAAVVRLAALFRRRRVEVAHLHNRLPLIYGAPAARLATATVVHTRHGPRRGSRAEEWLLRQAGRLIHAYVAVSPELADRAAQVEEVPAERLSVIENGIDLARFDASPERRRKARQALGLPADGWVLGSVGRLAPEKDYPFLVRASAPLLGPGVRLAIVGEGPERDAIIEETRTRGVEPFVHLCGPRTDVPLCLAAFDAFALCSRMEGMPLAVLEAMAAGLPVIATRAGGVPRLVDDGETGFLIPVGDETALRARLEMLRARPEEARAIGERARTRAQARYSGDEMVRRYLALYDRLRAAA